MLNNTTPWATIGVWFLTLIVALVGGAVVIWGKAGLDFKTYVEVLGAFGVGHGLLGIGRGINAGLTRSATIQNDPAILAPIEPPGATTEASPS